MSFAESWCDWGTLSSAHTLCRWYPRTVFGQGQTSTPAPCKARKWCLFLGWFLQDLQNLAILQQTKNISDNPQIVVFGHITPDRRADLDSKSYRRTTESIKKKKKKKKRSSFQMWAKSLLYSDLGRHWAEKQTQWFYIQVSEILLVAQNRSPHNTAATEPNLLPCCSSPKAKQVQSRWKWHTLIWEYLKFPSPDWQGTRHWEILLPAPRELH